MTWIDHIHILLELSGVSIQRHLCIPYSYSIRTNIDINNHVITCGSDLADGRQSELDGTRHQGRSLERCHPLIRGTSFCGFSSNKRLGHVVDRRALREYNSMCKGAGLYSYFVLLLFIGRRVVVYGGTVAVPVVESYRMLCWICALRSCV